MGVPEGLPESMPLGRTGKAADLPPAAVALRVGVAAVAFVVLAALILIHPPADLRYFFVFTLAIAAADTFLTVRIKARSYFSISPAFHFVYFVLAGGAAAAAQIALARSIVEIARHLQGRGRTTLATAYRIGEDILATIIAAFAVKLMLDVPAMVAPVTFKPVTAIVGFGMVWFLVCALMSSFAVYTRGGMEEVRDNLWPTQTAWSAVSVIAALPFAILLRLIAPAVGPGTGALLMFVLLAGIATVLRLNVDLRGGNDELKALARIGGLINASLDLPTLFRILARETHRVVPWDACFIAVTDPGEEKIHLVFMTGRGDELTQRSIPKGSGLTGTAIETGETVHYERGAQNGGLLEEDVARGGRKPRSIVVAPMKFGGSVLGAISIQSYQPDVYSASQIRLLETIAGQAAIALRNAQLFLSEQKARVERDEFLSLVTHEIKNPLTSIIGYAEIAEMEVSSGKTDGAASAMHVIRNEANRILRLAEDLLDASRMEGGRFSLQLEKVDFPDIVQSVTKKYAATSPHRIALRVEGELPVVECDRMRFEQVVENLLSNAVKYSPGEEPIEVNVGAAGDEIRLEVRDHGIGIPPEKLPLIFERFYRVEEEGQTVKGTGIGLYVSREIVRMHGGDITVSSNPGEGSTFTVHLPARRAEDWN
ncbi:MAG: sensor histidine kinase [Thermoanaerobaculia bacterium]